MKKNKFVTFGEIMMRLNPEGYLRLLQASKLEVSYAGGEANVAVSLANYGEEVSFVTKLPENDLGKCAVNEIRKFGVNTGNIVRGKGRMGLYFVEKGASQRASKVIYDRADSAIALAKREDFDWDKIFDGVTWFHFTGITPALGGNLPAICKDACRKAKEKNITVSCDLNYRNKLWSKEQAKEVMSGLMQYVDVCIANEEDAEDVFGIHADGSNIKEGSLNYDGYVQVAKKLEETFGLKYVAITLRKSISASRNLWSGMLYHQGNAEFSKEYDMSVVDRVGGGDSFGGALIYALANEYEQKEVIEFAAAASCLKHSIEHDFNLVSTEEVWKLARGDGSGRVQR